MKVWVVWCICGIIWLMSWTLAPAFSRKPGEAPPQDVTASERAKQAITRGKALEQEGKYREAIAAYQTALPALRAIRDERREAVLTSDLAIVYRKVGDFEQALALQQQAARLYERLGDLQGQAKALRRIGVVYRHQGKFFQAIRANESALGLLEGLDEPERIAPILTNLGIVYGDLGRLQEAQTYFEQALSIYTQCHNQEGVAYTLGNLGQLFLYLGDSQQALEYLNRSLTIKQQLSDRHGEANTLLNLGTAQRNFGDMQQALALYYDALDLYTQLNDQRGKAAALGSIGSVYEELEDFEQARQYQLQSLQFKKASGTPVHIAVALTNLASLAIKQRRFAEAEAYLQDALDIAISHNSLLAQANIYGQIGLSQLYQHENQRSLGAFSRSLRLYEDVGSQKGVLETLDFLGQAHIARHAFQEALPYYTRALELATDLNDINALWAVQYRLGQIYLNTARDDQALHFFQASVTTLEQMRSYLKVPELRQLFMRKQLNPYREVIRLLLKRHQEDDALLYLERFKARTFLEVIAHGAPQLHQVPELLQEEQYLAARIRFLHERLTSPFGQGKRFVHAPSGLESSSDMQQELYQAKEQYEQLLLRIKLQYPDYYRLKIVDSEEIGHLIRRAMQLLDDEIVMLEYFLDETDVHIWVIEREQIHYERFPVSFQQILENVLHFRATLSDYESSEVYRPLQNLYAWLIAPVEAYITEKSVVGIVPFQILHFVPFSCLVSRPRGEQTSADEMAAGERAGFFIDDHPVFSLPSLSLLPVVRERTRQTTREALGRTGRYLLGMGNASENLPGAQEEILSIVAHLSNSQGYTGKEASKQRLLDQSGQYDVIHLATHGVFDKQHPMFSYLEFSADSYLYAREIFGLQLKATLVTLSGCETLLPQQVNVDEIEALVSGDELVGFIRAFMYAGASSVLASLWRVNDTATRYLMSAFYEQLPELGKAKALQKASQTVMQSTLEVGRRKKKSFHMSHPFFWSSFVLTGDWK